MQWSVLLVLVLVAGTPVLCYNQGECVQVNAAGGVNGREKPCGTQRVMLYPDKTRLVLIQASPVSPTTNCSLGTFKWSPIDRINGSLVYAAEDFLISCAPVCGNGILENGETCDDGNILNGDGCSRLCGVEAGYYCSPPTQVRPSVCTLLTPAEETEDTLPTDDYGYTDEPIDSQRIEGPAADGILGGRLIEVCAGSGGLLIIIILIVIIVVFVVKRKKMMKSIQMDLEKRPVGSPRAQHPDQTVSEYQERSPRRNNWADGFTKIFGVGNQWEQRATDDGHSYYYNAQTGQARWTRMY